MSVAACTDYESSTNLHPEGPPKVQQVRMRETFTTPGDTSTSSRRIFAFGTHPDAIDVEQHSTQSAALSNNGFRIIMDELLVGNNLEEIACRSNVDGDAYSRVPLGATPDDIAKCATAQDVLPSTCKGIYATCMRELDGGCTVGTTMIPKGGPVGVDDKNQDGAADDTHLIAGSVGIRCGTVNVPIDINMSYWNPSGNQQPPAMGGFEALGPAIVLIPERGLPSNLDCSLFFAEDVVDKQNVRVCAPPNGDPDAECTPGDTANVKFKTEPMTFQSVTVTNNATGISRTEPIVFVSNTVLDPMAISGITVTAGGAAFTNFTVVLTMGKVLTLTPTGTGFPPNAAIVVTLTANIKDGFAQPLPTPFVVNFMTGP
ncbi:MAG: Ig-like domain-containing protein [Deltaproteobacteria bacterium]|nr:Ig-like domain-containing protein [Deltaproteobacteria bacterium]